MIIMGIDPGLAHTGWGVVETRGALCRARAYGCVTTSSSDPMVQRLNAIFQGISAAVERYGPTQLAIERIFFGENSRSAIATAQARGAALVACGQAGLEVGEYTPMQIKQAIVGTGSADKRQVIYMVRNVLALDHDPRPDHCADALAAAICHANLIRTQAIARDHAAAQMIELERAQKWAARDAAREATAAATAARLSHGEHSRGMVGRTRQSRRSTA